MYKSPEQHENCAANYGHTRELQPSSQCQCLTVSIGIDLGLYLFYEDTLDAYASLLNRAPALNEDLVRNHAQTPVPSPFDSRRQEAKCS
eukprot:1740125-Amphidinium_carterae.1